MANYINPNGFSQARNGSGSAWANRVSTYYIPSTDVLQYNVGDTVKSAAVADPNGVPGVIKITNGTDTVRGVIVGVLVVTPFGSTSLVGSALSLETTNIPATKSKNYYVLVDDSPESVFEIQDDGLSALTATAVNKNASYTVTNPTAPQQQSGTVLLTSSVATTAGLSLKIMGLAQRADNAFGAYARWLVKFNQHELQGNTAGI